MSSLVVTLLLLTMVATSFLSGIFGMAGGMILIGVLLALLPLPQAMVLHAVTQMASNGWRATAVVALYPLAAGVWPMWSAAQPYCRSGRSGSTCPRSP